MKSISVLKLSEKMKSQEVFILDVRNPDEYEYSNIGGLNIPLPIIHNEFTRLNDDKNQEIYCLCHHGVRSAMARDFLMSKGYTNVINIDGGIDAWSLEVDSEVPRY